MSHLDVPRGFRAESHPEMRSSTSWGSSLRIIQDNIEIAWPLKLVAEDEIWHELVADWEGVDATLVAWSQFATLIRFAALTPDCVMHFRWIERRVN